MRCGVYIWSVQRIGVQTPIVWPVQTLTALGRVCVGCLLLVWTVRAVKYPTEMLYRMKGLKGRILCKDPKKGDLSNCANYRYITLMSVPGKVFRLVLLKRARNMVALRRWDGQGDFRQNGSWTDQIAALLVIIERSLGWNSSLYIRFVGYDNDVRRIGSRDILWAPWTLVFQTSWLAWLVVGTFCDGMSCGVIHRGQLTTSFHVRTAGCQGFLVSPVLFLLAIDWIMRESTGEREN